MAGVVHFSSTNATNNQAAAATKFYPFGTCHIGVVGGLATENRARVPVPVTGSFQSLLITINANGVTAASTWQTRKGGANGNMSVSVGSSATGVFEDTTNVDNVVAGDLYCVTCVAGGTGTNIYARNISIHFVDASGATTGVYNSWDGSGASKSTDSATSFTYPSGRFFSTINGTVGSAQSLIRGAATVKRFFCNVISNARITATTTGVNKNGSNGAGTVSIPASTAGVFSDSSNTDTLAAGDLLSYYFTTSTGGSALVINSMGAWLTTTDNKFYSGTFRNATTVSAGLSATAPIQLAGDPSGATTQAFAQIKPRMKLRAFSIGAIINSNGITATSTITFRLNGANTAVQLSIPASTSGTLEDTTHSAFVNPADLINHELVTGGTGTTIVFQGWFWGAEALVDQLIKQVKQAVNRASTY